MDMFYKSEHVNSPDVQATRRAGDMVHFDRHTCHIQVTIGRCGGIFWRLIVSFLATLVTECSKPPPPPETTHGGALVWFRFCTRVMRNEILLTSLNRKRLNVHR